MNKKKKSFLSLNVFLFFIIGFASAIFIAWCILPKFLYSAKEQPINFNHLVHVEQTGDCSSCHYFRDDGTFSGIPKTEACVDCHQEVQGGTQDEEIFVNEYVLEGKEVPWLVYSRQPDCVFFSHAAHVKKAEIECSRCHGNIGESEKSKTYYQNRISKYSKDIWGDKISGFSKGSMKMDDCAKCHKQVNGEQGACFLCHK